MRAAVQPLTDACRGRRVIVVGPSPGVRLPSTQPGDVVYAVNGGAGCVTDRPVDLWQVNGRADRASLRIQPTDLRRAWLDQGRDRHVAGLVVFMRDVEGLGTIKELVARGCTWGWTVDVMKKWRGPILTASGVTDGAALSPSAGVIALCLALLADAASVVACGFSWQSGYAYLPAHPLTIDPHQRGHVADDRTVVAALLATYGTERLQTTSPDLRAAGLQDTPCSLISSLN